MTKLKMAAQGAALLPTEDLWEILMGEEDSPDGAVQVCAELRSRGAL